MEEVEREIGRQRGKELKMAAMVAATVDIENATDEVEWSGGVESSRKW